MRKLLLIFLILVVAFVGAVIAVPFFFKGQIVDMIKKSVNKEINARVDFSEDIGLSLLRNFPNLTLRMDDLLVVNNAPFEGDTLLAMEQFTATLDIMSVIKGDEIRIRSINLIKPTIKATVLEDGRASWDITFSDTVAAEPDADTSATPFKVSLKKYSIEGADVLYDDRQNDLFLQVQGLTHEGKGDFTQDDFVLETNTLIEALTCKMAGIPYLNKVNTELKCNLGINMPSMRFVFQENNLRLNALEVGFDGKVAMPGEDIDLDLKLISNKAGLKEIMSLIPAVYLNDFDQVEVSGNTQLSAMARGILNTDLERYPAFDVSLLVEKGSFTYPELPQKLKDIGISLKVSNGDGNLDHTVVNLEKLHFLFGEEAFDAKMLLTNPMSDPFLDVVAKGAVQLDRVGGLVPLDSGVKIAGRLLADMQAKGHVSTFTGTDYESMQASGMMQLTDFVYQDPSMLPLPLNLKDFHLLFDPRKVELKNLTGNLGHSDFAATGSVENFFGYLFKEGEVLQGQLDLTSNLFDCNSFLSEDQTEQKTEPEAGDTVELTAFRVPGNILFNMSTSMNTVLYDNLKLNNVKGQLQVVDQTLKFEDLQAGIFGGRILMKGVYDSREEKPITKLALNLEQINIKESFQYINTLKTLAPVAGYLVGNFNANLNLQSRLNDDMSPVLSSILSEGLLQTTEAVLSGFKPMNMLADKLQLNSLKEFSLQKTNVSFAIEEGMVRLKKALDLKIDKIQLHVNEDGYTTFEQLLNFKMRLTVPRAVLGAAGNAAFDKMFEEAGNLGLKMKTSENLVVNALLGGTIQNPTITTSLNEIKDNLVDQAREELQRELDAKKQEAIRKANEELQKRIDAASKKGDELIATARKQADMIREEARKKTEQLTEKTNQEIDKLVKEAGSNPVKKLAAEKAADKLRQELKTKIDGINREADNKANELIRKAEAEKQRLINEANR